MYCLSHLRKSVSRGDIPGASLRERPIGDHPDELDISVLRLVSDTQSVYTALKKHWARLWFGAVSSRRQFFARRPSPGCNNSEICGESESSSGFSDSGTDRWPGAGLSAC